MKIGPTHRNGIYTQFFYAEFVSSSECSDCVRSIFPPRFVCCARDIHSSSDGTAQGTRKTYGAVALRVRRLRRFPPFCDDFLCYRQ